MSKTGVAKSSSHDPLVIALIVLTFSTGLIDAANYIGLGRVFPVAGERYTLSSASNTPSAV